VTQTNVHRLRQEGVLPQDATLDSDDEAAINALSTEEVNAVLAVHAKVGTVEVEHPTGRLFIF
jgi:hypothetical protein